MKRLFPMFVKLEARPVLVVGAGTVAEGKIRGLLDTGARIRVVAQHATDAVREWAKAKAIALEERKFSPGDLDGVFLVIAATSSRKLHELISGEAQRRGMMCNVVDVPDLCDFFYPAVVRRGDLQIAISTAGQSPSLAQWLRQDLERQYGQDCAQWVAQLGESRRGVLASNLPASQKRQLLRSLASREECQAAIAEKGKGERA